MITDLTHDVLEDLLKARKDQELYKEQGRFTHTCDEADLSLEGCVILIGREYGEILQLIPAGIGSHSVHGKGTPEEIMQELTQMAALCVATIEKLEVLVHC
jgi:hypothetical protein